MKTINTILLFAVAILLSVSCAKDAPEVGYYDKPIDMDSYKKKGLEMAHKLPDFAFYDQVNDRVIRVNFHTKSFSFAEPNSGWNYSDDDDLTFVPYEDGGGILYVGSSSLNGNTGGTLLLGDNVLNITNTFCVSVANEAIGLDVFYDGDNEFDGFSIVMGIAGDFEALENGEIDENSNFTDFFQGIAWFYVYDNEAQGNYEVVDWFENSAEDDYSGFGNKGFAMAISFENFDVYFSLDGDINVSGGDMTFSGSVFSLLNLIDSFFDEDLDSVDAEVVDGYGTMGC